MKYTTRILALLLAGVLCAASLVACRQNSPDQTPSGTEPSVDALSEYADLSPAQLYQALLEAKDYTVVAHLKISNAPDESMLRKILHKDEGRLFARTEAYDGQTATRSTVYADLDAALRYTQEGDEWVSQADEGGREALEIALNEVLTISELLPAEEFFVNKNYDGFDGENNSYFMTESTLQTIFGEYKSEVTYTKNDPPGTYTLYATVLQKGVRHTLTLTVQFADVTVEIPQAGGGETPGLPETDEQVPPVVAPSEDVDPPTTDIPEVDPTDAKALIDRADYLMGLLHSYTSRSKTEMGMKTQDQTIVYTRLHELRADIVCKQVWEEAHDSYISIENGVLSTSDGIIYYDEDIYLMDTDGVKQMAPMNGEALEALINNLTATVETDLSIFRSVTVTEGTHDYSIVLAGLIEGSDPDSFLGGMLGNTGEMTIDYDSFAMSVGIAKDTGLYTAMDICFTATVAMEGIGEMKSDLEFYINYYDFNSTAIEKPVPDDYTEVPLESLLG